MASASLASVFQVHGVDAEGQVVIRQRLGRARLLRFFAKLPRCLIGIEACATAHPWARRFRAIDWVEGWAAPLASGAIEE